MGKIIALTSGKGGSGKTTIAAALAYAYAKLGSRTCLIDGCNGLRALDLALNVQDRIVFDFADLASDDCSMEQALVSCDPALSLSLVAAAQTHSSDGLGHKQTVHTIERLKKRFDVLIADVGSPFTLEASGLFACADAILLVMIPGAEALRNTEYLSSYLYTHYHTSIHLLFNSWEARSLFTTRAKTPESIAAYLDIPLLGILPYSKAITYAAQQQKTPSAYPAKVQDAFEQMAKKLKSKMNEGKEQPI